MSSRSDHRDNMPSCHSSTSDETAEPADGCCGSDHGESTGPSRREFIKLAGASAASLAVGKSATAALSARPGAGVAKDHFVPVDKKLDPAWLKALTARGGPTFYGGDDLETIAMPIGGICAGQVYLTGDGRLAQWDVFNKHNFTGYGRDCYNLGREPESPLAQGFAVKVQAGGKTLVRTLDRQGFPGVRFCGEYPIATVEYEDEGVPVSIRLEAFSPFVPLDAEDSALPAVLMQYTLKNTSAEVAEVTLAGWLENGACHHCGDEMSGTRTYRLLQRGGMTTLLGGAKPAKEPPAKRPPIVLADFEGKDYGDWTVQGEAFGKGPARGTLAEQQEVGGFQGKGLVNTYLGGNDQLQGKLTSPPFRIERRFISFLIGGGNEAGKTCVNLLVDGKVVRTAVGDRTEKLKPHNWNVVDLEGKQGRLEIVDQASEGWGHVNVDQIEFRDTTRTVSGPLESQPDFGTMGLSVLPGDGDVLHWLSVPEGALPDALFSKEPVASGSAVETPFGKPQQAALGSRLTLPPGKEARVTFAFTWHFPNRPERGNFYCRRFSSAAAVAEYVRENLDRLTQQTRLWHDTWYDSTLPHWLLDRLFSTVSNLATSTCQWWANGRFWAWEGVGCCHGTCTHVWNYEHAMARLFPRLERSVREMQDYHPEAGFVEESGMVRFRGEGWGMWAGDGQAGTILKAYREHLVSPDDKFLKRLWPRIRKSLEFLIDEDAKPRGQTDGLLEDKQHNTYDIDFYGANTMIGSLYLAALRAGEEMAREVGDDEFAKTCRALFESGSRLTVGRLFNGEYFIQEVDLQQHPKAQYAGGCLSDQLFGQGWAHQVGVGYVYSKESVVSTLEAIWKYNWAPDVGPQNEHHKPERFFASPGEAGLFTCTWPHSPHLAQGVRYKNEVWTGIEYQVAGHMAWDGMVTEALAICRGVHDRYHPAKHNPWNEVECGDHYARAMAAHGVFLGLCGFEYHGPKAHLGFAPRIAPEDFRAAFTAAEGWGALSQRQTGNTQTNALEVRWGKVRVKTFAFELPEDAKMEGTRVTAAGKAIQANAKQDGRRVTITLPASAVVEQGQAVEVQMSF